MTPQDPPQDPALDDVKKMIETLKRDQTYPSRDQPYKRDQTRPLAAKLNPFAGMRIIESPFLEQDGEPIEVRRTWRERLFTWPWTPFIATKTIIPKVPYEGALKINEHTLLMHPQFRIKLRQRLAYYDMTD